MYGGMHDESPFPFGSGAGDRPGVDLDILGRL